VARNRGISESRGSILAFTDDDVDVDPAWMAELWRAAGAYPEAAFFGGKIVPLWKESPPPWMVEYSSGMLSGVTMDFNLGQEERLLEKNELFFGANMAFRREMVLKMGLFRVDLGVNGNSLLSNEETEYMERLIEAGYRGLYVPRMVVHHRNPNDRMTESYMLRWFTGCGASHVRLGKVESSPFQLFGAPRYLWRQLAASACTYLARRWNPAAGATWVPSARYMAMVWGSISEFRRMARDRKKS
jgi:GT2 family glycosyltransferase